MALFYKCIILRGQSTGWHKTGDLAIVSQKAPNVSLGCVSRRVRGVMAEPPVNRSGSNCISYFLYFLRGIVEIQHLDMSQELKGNHTDF